MPTGQKMKKAVRKKTAKPAKKVPVKDAPVIYESYPPWIVLVTAAAALLGYLAGGFIMFRLHVVTGLLYIIFILILEFKLYEEACPNCCYYGKLCAFGRGKVARIFFRKGDPKKFGARKITWKDLVPQMLVMLVPLVVGIALLISRGWNWLVFIAVLYPILNWFLLNPVIYGQLACRHCKQGSKCCPAIEFFSKKGK